MAEASSSEPAAETTVSFIIHLISLSHHNRIFTLISDVHVDASQATTEETPADPAKVPKPKSPSFLSKLLAPLKRQGPKSPKKEKTESEVG